MAHIERMQTECPPDAHKVIRPPETEVKATICVKLNEAEEQKYGIADFCEVLALMSAKPLVMCSRELEAKIEAQKGASQIEPGYLRIDGDLAYVSYGSGAQGPAQPYYDLAAHPENSSAFFDELRKKQFLIIDSLSMLTLRSISTVFPWDGLLAGDFLRQYINAREKLSESDLEILGDIRYGRKDGFSIKNTHENAYNFQRIERKLFLQYPTEDDD